MLGVGSLCAERAVEMINHLPPPIEGLKINSAPYGSPFINAMIDWIDKSNNLKYLLYLFYVCLVEGMWMKVEMQASN